MFNWLTKSTKTVDDIFDKDSGLLTKVGSWVGNYQFTDEERAEMNSTTAKAVRDFVVATLDESTDRSKARREIAVFFIKFYALLVFMAGITYPVQPEWSKVWFDLSTSLSVGGLVAAISVFFFGSYGAVRYQQNKAK